MADDDKKELQGLGDAFDAKAFEALERDFQEVLFPMYAADILINILRSNQVFGITKVYGVLVACNPPVDIAVVENRCLRDVLKQIVHRRGFVSIVWFSSENWRSRLLFVHGQTDKYFA
eukprot:3435530-Pyramimonas_sp.AAC.1